MVSLVDLGPVSKQVEISVGEVAVYGIEIGTIRDLLVRFPEARAAWSIGGLGVDDVLVMFPNVLAALVGQVTRQPDAEDNIRQNLPLGDQLDIAMAAIDLTMPRGVRPLAEWIERTMPQKEIGSGLKPLGPVNGSTAPVTSSPSSSSI